jgi:hypothetical protein
MIWYHCRSCLVTYDGFAQCCPDLDHVQLEVASDEEVSDVNKLIELNIYSTIKDGD